MTQATDPSASETIWSVAMSPDGTRVYTGGHDGTVREWDAATGNPIGAPWTGHTGAVTTLAVSPDGGPVFSGSDDGTLRVWAAPGGAPIGEPRPLGQDGVKSVVLSPDGALLYTGGVDGTVREWEAPTGNPIGAPWATSHAVGAVAVSPQGQRLYAACYDGTVWVWDAAESPVGPPWVGHELEVNSLVLSPDGTRLYTGGADGTIRAWDAVSGARIGEPWIGLGAGAVRSVALSPDGRWLYAAGGRAGAVNVWDTASGTRLGEPWMGYQGETLSVAVSSDGIRVVTGADHGMTVWDAATGTPVGGSSAGPGREPLGRLVGEPWAAGQGSVWSMAVSPDGARVFTGGGVDGTVRVWDAVTGAPIGEPWAGHRGAVLSVAVSPDGARVFTGGGDGDGTVRVWDAVTGAPIGEPWTGHDGGVLSVAVSPDGARVFTGGGDGDGTVRVWDAVTGASIGEPRTGHRGPVLSVAVSPDGARVFTGDGGGDGTVRVWDAVTGASIGEPWTGHDGGVSSVAVSPDGARAFTGGRDGTVRVWDAVTGASIGEPWTGHRGAVSSVAVSPDGARVFTGGGVDGTVRAWSWDIVLPARSVHRYAGVQSDVASTEDQLGMDADATTIAALIAALDTRPPLSIALMGNWGSGKSTFMTLVQKHVAAFAEDARDQPSSAYAADVRQVVFNAWHYSDDHLWVGLVEHLFRELRDQDPAAETTSEERLTLEADLAKQKAWQARLDDQLKQVDALDPDRGWWGWLGQLQRSATVIRAVGGEARRQWRAKMVLAVALLLLAVALGVIAVLVGPAVAGWVRGLGWVAGAAALIGAARTRLTAAWTVAQRFTENARKRLLADRAARAVTINGLERQLTERDPARQLDQLLAEITDPNRYSSYRGLTGRIHHDLRRLSEQLARAREQDRPTLQRIILYIDDLDRCVSSRVIDVLQAVNLLLSMDLFVVVVAVDPRWLLRALTEHHGDLLATRPTPTADAADLDELSDNGHGRSLDYLDKIFHVPYAVRPMNEHATAFLRDLLPTVAAEPAQDTGRETAASVRPAPVQANEPDTAAGPAEGAPTPNASPQPTIGSPQPAAATPASSTNNYPATTPETTSGFRWRPPTPPPDVRSLQLLAHEAEFIPQLGDLVPTPRGIKKLANTYRLLRISIPDEHLDQFLGDRDHGGPYQAAALLLTAIIGHPDQARALLDHLATGEPGDDVADTLAANPGILTDQLATFITNTRASGLPVHGATRTYQRWAHTVARYSFDTYDLFTEDPAVDQQP